VVEHGGGYTNAFHMIAAVAFVAGGYLLCTAGRNRDTL
jgi:hypothetical protein